MFNTHMHLSLRQYLGQNNIRIVVHFWNPIIIQMHQAEITYNLTG